MTTSRSTLAQLAQQAAAQIGFTARRWWRDPADPNMLRVEVERRLVGAPPAVAELAVPISQAEAPALRTSDAVTPPRSRRATRSPRASIHTQQHGARRAKRSGKVSS